ncbi:unnamed protein product [Pedinophyceae sp. YPF-701]|nr:unnamed protein product [Pedinophyceae sp. YPF-701]
MATQPRQRVNAQGAAQGAPQSDLASLELPTTRVASSVILQQVLYYNISLFVTFIIAQIIILYQKYGSGVVLEDPDIARTILLSLYSAVEPGRLWLGYSGNLREDVPTLLVFQVFCIAPCFPFWIFMYIAQKTRTPLDEAIAAFFIAWHVLSFVLGARAIYKIMREQRRRFNIAKITDFMTLGRR